MKKTASFTFVMVVLCLAAFSQPKVTVYTYDFSGLKIELGIGKYDHLTLVRAGVSVVRSIKIPAGLQVTIFEKDNFEGTSLALTQDANMKLLEGKGFGKVIQNVSLVVAKAPESLLNEPVITIYKDNFSGAALNLRAGYYDHYELGAVDNDHLSSVKIPKGLKATLYEHGGYKGRALLLTQDATADFLIKNKFNDITSSIYVEVVPEAMKEIPVVTEEPVEPKEEPPVVVAEVADDTAFPKATFFEDNFTGASKKLGAGRYDVAALGIKDNSLSSIKMPAGLTVTLYELANFKGKSLTLNEGDASTEFLQAKRFDNIVSSIVIELIPRVTIYADNYAGNAASFEPGYYHTGELQIGNDELSSVRVLPGVWILLFEHSQFQGRSLLLTQDASNDFLSGKDFDNTASSMIVGSKDTPLPVVTLFDDDREDAFKKLTPGDYPLLESGNNMLSSIEIPRGLKVTLFEDAGYEGRSMQITKSVGTDFMKKHAFNNLTSSLIIEQRDPRELVVTIYSGSYGDFSQTLTPGEYFDRDLEIGEKDLTSVKVPRGMQVELFASNDHKGVGHVLDRDTDFAGFKLFDNHYTSLIVRDIHQPIVTPIPTTAPPAPDTVSVPIDPPAPVEEPEPAPRSVYSYDPPCTMNDDQFQNALTSIKAKAFSDEKMEMVMLVTKDKCMTNDQIREIARQFSFEEQTLEFVKYAYDKAKEKDTYYKLEDVFKFMSSRDAFRKFLKER